MNNKSEEAKHPESLLETWMKTAAAYWEASAKMWPSFADDSQKATAAETETRTRAQESWESVQKTMRTLSKFMGETGDAEALFKGIHTMPEILLKLAQTGWEGFFRLQQQGLERAGKIGETTKAYKYENLDQDALKVWSELYEKEFRPFLNIPQLGLTRGHQERANRAVDKFNLFQGAIGEFLHILYLPMEKSFKVMQDKIAELSDAGKLPETTKEYYQMWIKVLEGHYMTLFKTPEYTEAMGKTLSALEDFRMARQEFLEDTLEMYPVPTQKEMDELYKEVYLLKKRLRAMEQKKE